MRIDGERFVQIAAAACADEDGPYVSLFALDEEGDVWRYEPSVRGDLHARWVYLSCGRAVVSEGRK